MAQSTEETRKLEDRIRTLTIRWQEAEENNDFSYAEKILKHIEKLNAMLKCA